MARIAENTVIVDGQEYKPGDVIPDFKSIKCVDTREPRKYQGLSADVSVLNDVIAKYASGGASCFMSDTGEYYEYDRKEKTWKLITNITERGFDAEKAYGALKHMLKNVTVSDEKIQSAVTNYLTVNPVLPGATTEQAQQIEQNKTDVASLKEETGSLKEDLISKADKTSLVKTDRKLDALWKLNQGISYEFQTDDAEAYQKTVPSGAKVASIKSIGGKTIVWNQLNLNNEQSITKNGISFINNKDGSWTINGTCSVSNDEGINTIVYLFASKYVSGHKYLVKADKYSDGNYGFAINGRTYPLKKAIIISYAFNPVIFVKDKVTVDNVTMRMNIFDLTQMFGAGNEPSTPEEFEAMFPADYYPYNAGELMSASVNEVIYLDTKNQETSYPIPQAILDLDGYGESGNFVDFVEKKYHKGDRTIDISDIMGDTFQDPLEVEAGGTLTFKNSHGDDYRIPIPSSEEYVISLAEVAK